MLSYPYFIYTHKDLDDAMAYQIVEMLHRSRETLITYIPAFRDFDPEAMNPAIGVPYHAGAERFYGERADR